ncbi:MAG: class I SAM-dependent methyltransferase [Hyphomicrobiales bacterium]
MSLVQRLDKLWYPNHEHAWDAKNFRKRILEKVSSDMTLLDVGSGRGAEPAMNFRDIAKKVYGADIDPAAMDNPYLDEPMLFQDGELPKLEDATIDLAFSCNVWEHVADPKPFLKEVNRVLVQDGLFLAKTPNFWHYMPIIAHLTPHWFHVYYNKLRGRNVVDTFPTVYALNTYKDIKRHAEENGYEVLYIEAEEGRPEYLRISAFTYVFGYLYERAANLLGLNSLKVVYYIALRKK